MSRCCMGSLRTVIGQLKFRHVFLSAHARRLPSLQQYVYACKIDTGHHDMPTLESLGCDVHVCVHYVRVHATSDDG